MKVGIVGAGAVGTACMFALALRGSAREIVLVNRNYERARGAVADLQYGAVLTPHVSLRVGDYDDLRDAAIVMITAGANEKKGGATDRDDPWGG
jgi:L-lactate dehydrogenase